MSTRRKVHGKRSFTGNHSLLPAMGPEPTPFMPKVPTYTFLKWTFGRGSVVRDSFYTDLFAPPFFFASVRRWRLTWLQIWKIWPAVLLHTLFAASIVYVWMVSDGRMLEIPNVMLTVLGVCHP